MNIVEEVKTLYKIIQDQSRDIKKMDSEGLALTLKCNALADENMNLKAGFDGSLNQNVGIEAENISLEAELSDLNQKFETQTVNNKRIMDSLVAENANLRENFSCLKERFKTLEESIQRVWDSLELLICI